MNDPETDAIVMIGEIGGGMEAEAARWIKFQPTNQKTYGHSHLKIQLKISAFPEPTSMYCQNAFRMSSQDTGSIKTLDS